MYLHTCAVRQRPQGNPNPTEQPSGASDCRRCRASRGRSLPRPGAAQTPTSASRCRSSSGQGLVGLVTELQPEDKSQTALVRRGAAQISLPSSGLLVEDPILVVAKEAHPDEQCCRVLTRRFQVALDGADKVIEVVAPAPGQKVCRLGLVCLGVLQGPLGPCRASSWILLVPAASRPNPRALCSVSTASTMLQPMRPSLGQTVLAPTPVSPMANFLHISWKSGLGPQASSACLGNTSVR